MKTLLMTIFVLVFVSGTAMAECFKGEVVDVTGPTTLSVKCLNSGTVRDIPLYGLAAKPGMEERGIEFLKDQVLGQNVNCFLHNNGEFYVTYSHGGSVQNLYLVSGCASIDQLGCTMFICNDMLKHQNLGAVARKYQ